MTRPPLDYLAKHSSPVVSSEPDGSSDVDVETIGSSTDPEMDDLWQLKLSLKRARDTYSDATSVSSDDDMALDAGAKGWGFEKTKVGIH